MVNEVIEKEVDIYTYPDELDDNSGALTIGDLHGNVVKLLHFLLRQGVLRFKTNVIAPKALYEQFVNLYERNSEISEMYLEKTAAIGSKNFSIQNHQNNIDNYTQRIQGTTDEDEKNTYSQLKERSLGFKKTLEAEKKILQDELDKALTEAKLPEQLDEFNAFLNELEVNDKTVLVRLIGDELADRGGNDYFTLRLLNFLHQQGVNLSITISNHSNEFITAYENLFKNNGLVPLNHIINQQKPSFFGLKLLYEKQLVSEEEIKQLVNTAYKPTLKILDYSLSEKGITLFSHAPVRFDAIKAIAKRFGVTYKDSSKEALARTIDQINTKFADIVQNNSVQTYCSLPTNSRIRMTEMSKEQIQEYPLIHIIWNRWSQDQDTQNARPSSINGYEIVYCHGHDSSPSQYQHVINLDTLCGKQSLKHEKASIQKAEESRDNNFLKELFRYKILKSDECRLNPNQTLTQRSTSTSTDSLNLNTLLFLGAIGVGLFLTGMAIFAPFPVSVLGAVALAGTLVAGLTLISAAFGLSMAKEKQVMPMNTAVLSEDTVDNVSEKNECNCAAKAMSQLGGRVQQEVQKEPTISNQNDETNETDMTEAQTSSNDRASNTITLD